MDAPVRVAVVGAGYMGSIHARVVARLSEERPGLAELAYVVDVDRARAEALARDLGARAASSPWDIPRGEVDLAIVATPTRLHVETVRGLASAGVTAMLVEKPLADSLEGAAEIVRLEEREGLWISVGHSERFNPALSALFRLERESGFKPSRAHAISARRRAPFTPRAAGVDVVHDLASHDVDVSLSLVRALPERLRAYHIRGAYTKHPDYSTAHLWLDWTIIHIEASRLSPPKERVVDIIEPGRTVRLDLLRGRLYTHDSSGLVEHPTPPRLPIDAEDEAVIEALAAGREPPVTTAQATAVLFICKKILESADRHVEVTLRRDPDYARYEDIIDRGVEEYRARPDPLHATA